MFLDTWMVYEILGVVILIISGLYIYFKHFAFAFWRKRGVYNMEPSFPAGNIMPILTGKMSLPEFFKIAYDQNKKHRLLGIYMLHKPYLMVNDPDLIRDVLAKEFTSFHDRGVFCNPETDPLSGNIFQMTGKKWRHLRVKLTPTFTSGKIKQIFPIFQETGDKLAKCLDQKAELKESINVKDIFIRYFIDIIMSTAFGITCDTINNPDNEIRYWAKKIFEAKPFWNAIMLFAPQVLDLFSLPYYERSVTKFFSTLFRETVEYRESHNIVRQDVMNLLIQLMKNGYVEPDDDSEQQETGANIAENKLTLAEATAQAYIFYLAGFETSSTTVTFCLYELAKHQDIQDKLRDEIRTAVKNNGGVTYNALSDMPYLHKVISETLRKYPPGTTITRSCTKETTLETTNVTVPVGTLVIIPVYALHWDPNIYPEPEKFDPERFNEENIRSRHQYTYLPFGKGPRTCAGYRFGYVQVKVAIINTLLNHRLKPTSDMPDALEFMRGSIILLPKRDVYVNIETVA